MPKFSFWGAIKKFRKASSSSPAPAVPSASQPSNSKPNNKPSKYTQSLDLRDDFPKRERGTISRLRGYSSPEASRTMDSGRSCSPGTTIERVPPSRRVYIVTNGDDQDAGPSSKNLGSKSPAFDCGRGQRSCAQAHASGSHRVRDMIPGFEEVCLPHGWESRMDNRSGRVFYINHNTGTTSFYPPPITQENCDELGPLPPWWEMKVLDNGKTVFVDHETKTTTLRDPRKSLPVAQFIRKTLYLQRIMRRERRSGHFEIEVRKTHVFEDSSTIISSARVNDLRKSPSVTLDGSQPGQQAKQWSELLLDVAFSTVTGLFQIDERARDRLKITHHALQSTNSIPYFKFLGRLHGMCVLHNFPIDPKMVPLFYPLMCEQVVDRPPGSARANGLIPEAIEESIPTYREANGLFKIVDGRTEPPFSVYRPPLDSDFLLGFFMDGFWEVVRNKTVFQGYTETDFCKLIGGVTEINSEEHSDCQATNEEDGTIGWFWRVVKSWPPEYRKALLRYATGFKRVPATDKFKILGAPKGSDYFTHFSVQAVQERAILHDGEVALVHVLFVPSFRTCQELEENLLHTIRNSDPEPNVIDGYAEFVG